ncbi:FAD-dependent oxidoreductase [Caulobacter sp. 17J65-9]|uniref:NAD(P)/FAD-dependent oxidoreductase n=1 Tax=Caulobacter sp. 17J65-9 TaxID=2709382 RepID=UPI0013C6DF80|nr:FAD-dependent oxidoreductase [Caulobacter sp. 17J65-9]NEX91232.1 FAD-dependent oxidoreductase [Caulobacter sp. 17J65-9]
MRVVIVGAGHAGGSAAAFLRQFGFSGDIVLIGDEPLAPYQRPPLSKAWLKGEADGEALQLRPESFYAEQGVDLRLNERVTEIDRRLKLVRLATGEPVSYDALILATGSTTHKLPVPGGDHPALLELRTAADADKLKAKLTPGSRLIIVGAGYVGLEVAASARALGCEAVVVEREARVLARVASEPLSVFFESYHRARGVEILTGAAVTAVEAQGRAVRLADGRAVMGETVLVGIGAAANDGLARTAGVVCDGGIVVDLEARTSDPAIFAIGDCTRRPLPVYGSTGRLESVPNALEQAKQAAAAIVGAQAPAGEIPWFWSDQYDVKLQIAGLPHEVDRIVLRGDPAEAKFAVFHLSRGVVQAVEAVNAPPEFMAGRQMISRRISVDPTALSDTSVPIKSLLR